MGLPSGKVGLPAFAAAFGDSCFKASSKSAFRSLTAFWLRASTSRRRSSSAASFSATCAAASRFAASIAASLVSCDFTSSSCSCGASLLSAAMAERSRKARCAEKPGASPKLRTCARHKKPAAR